MKLWWRTKPAGDEYVDVTDYSRSVAIRESLYDAYANSVSKVLRISGKPQRKGQTITAPVERQRV